MKFKVLGPKHSQYGKTYKTGDIILTGMDLEKMFGKNRFARVDLIPDPNPDPVFVTTTPVKPEPEKIKPEPEKKESKTVKGKGTLCTASFPLAVEECFCVYRRGGWYHVFEDEHSDSPLNEKGIKKAHVDAFIREYLEG